MATISEDYVSFETAKLLKSKKFHVPTRSHYDGRGGFGFLDICEIDWNNYKCFRERRCYSAPTQAMAMKWLREVHNIVIGVNVLNENNKGNTDYSNPDRWWYFWEFTDTKGVYKEELQPDPLSNEYSTYEEATEEAIKYSLKNLI